MKYLLLILALNTSEGTATTTIPMADEIACNQAQAQIRQAIKDKVAAQIGVIPKELGDETDDLSAVADMMAANSTPVMLCVKQ